MGKAAKPPESYHFQIATLQRMIAVSSKDPRISVEDKQEIRHHVNAMTTILSKVVDYVHVEVSE